MQSVTVALSMSCCIIQSFRDRIRVRIDINMLFLGLVKWGYCVKSSLTGDTMNMAQRRHERWTDGTMGKQKTRTNGHEKPKRSQNKTCRGGGGRFTVAREVGTWHVHKSLHRLQGWSVHVQEVIYQSPLLPFTVKSKATEFNVLRVLKY
jgi:hypothetical protein